MYRKAVPGRIWMPLALILFQWGFGVEEGGMLLASGWQVSQPGSTPQSSPMTQDEVAGSGNPQAGQPTEVSARLFESLQSLFPTPISDESMKQRLLSAVRLFVAGQETDAGRVFDEVRQSVADLPPTGLLLAGLNFGSGNAARARGWLEKTTLDQPDYPTAWSGLARIAINERRNADALALLEKSQRCAVEGTSWSPSQLQLFRKEYLDGMADVQMARGQNDVARQLLVELKQLDPDNSNVPVRLAQIEFEQGNLDSCVEQLGMARASVPSMRVPEAIVADWFLQAGNPEAAEKWLGIAVSSYPDNSDVLMDQARLNLDKEAFNAALQGLGAAEEKGASPDRVRFLKAQIAFAQRNYDLARASFEELARRSPGDADVMNMLALTLAESDVEADKERGLEMALVNQQLYPSSVSAAAAVGWLNLKLNKVAEAEQVLQQVFATNNVNAAIAWFGANLLVAQGENEAAIKLLEQAVATTDFFLYRSSANELLTRLRAQTDSAAPSSGAANPDGNTP